MVAPTERRTVGTAPGMPGNAGRDLRFQRTFNSKDFRDEHGNVTTMPHDSFVPLQINAMVKVLWTTFCGRCRG